MNQTEHDFQSLVPDFHHPEKKILKHLTGCGLYIPVETETLFLLLALAIKINTINISATFILIKKWLGTFEKKIYQLMTTGEKAIEKYNESNQMKKIWNLYQ